MLLLAPITLGLIAEVTSTGYAFGTSTAVMAGLGGFFFLNGKRAHQSLKLQKEQEARDAKSAAATHCD